MLIKTLSLLITLSFLGSDICRKTNDLESHFVTNSVNIRLTNKATDARKFCQANGYNSEFCILIDMAVHSGKKRFYIYNLKTDSIEHQFLVSHGCCDNPWSSDYSKSSPVFSNVDGSHCSALGKYKIGERAYSNWGINVKYVLKGLEPTNSNAEKRIIVLHSWEGVTDYEVYPQGTREGWGCPCISDNSLRILDPKLKASKKPVLLWIYK